MNPRHHSLGAGTDGVITTGRQIEAEIAGLISTLSYYVTERNVDMNALNMKVNTMTPE